MYSQSDLGTINFSYYTSQIKLKVNNLTYVTLDCMTLKAGTQKKKFGKHCIDYLHFILYLYILKIIYHNNS